MQDNISLLNRFFSQGLILLHSGETPIEILLYLPLTNLYYKFILYL